MEAARAAGLAPAPEAAPVRPTVPEIEIQEVVREIEVVREVPAPQADALIVDKPLRSGQRDRKSTRLNSSHLVISYAVFCLKKKKKTTQYDRIHTNPTVS